MFVMVEDTGRIRTTAPYQNLRRGLLPVTSSADSVFIFMFEDLADTSVSFVVDIRANKQTSNNIEFKTASREGRLLLLRRKMQNLSLPVCTSDTSFICDD